GFVCSRRQPRRSVSSAGRSGLAQRIGRLNNIRPAARAVAGRIEHEALGHERFPDERSPQREIVRDSRRAGAAKPGEGHMRQELARLRLKPDAPQAPLLLGLQTGQRPLRLDAGDDRARLRAAERAQPLETHRDKRAAYVAERLGDVARRGAVHVADEPERDVIVLRLDPARADAPPRASASSSATAPGNSSPVNRRGIAVPCKPEPWQGLRPDGAPHERGVAGCAILHAYRHNYALRIAENYVLLLYSYVDNNNIQPAKKYYYNIHRRNDFNLARTQQAAVAF